MALKLYKATFDPMWPVPCGLVILAGNRIAAMTIAEETVTHTKIKSLTEVGADTPGVVFYESGDY